MLCYIICLFLGDLYLQTFAQLPSLLTCCIALFAGIAIGLVLHKWTRYAFLPLAFCCGFIYAYLYASMCLSWILPKELEGEPLLITGYVASLPNTDAFATQFEFKLLNYSHDNISHPQSTLVRLAWQNPPSQLLVGDKWQFLVHLKRIHSTENPGSFDFEAWALQNDLRATGYITASPQNVLLQHSWYRYFINQCRQRLQFKIQAFSQTTPINPWITALIIGERVGIPQDDWQVLRNTGTNHLMAIAGLHIGVIASITHMLVTFGWRRRSRLALLLPAQLAGACAALSIAIIYSALAGFSIPTQRACIMLSVCILSLLLKRKLNPWHAWAVALFLVLILNPLSVLSESFWLSFYTLALIIFGMQGRLNPSGMWWKWGRVQWIIGVGLIPLTLNLFQESSLISFVANSIAIPWLAFGILPFCFLSGIFLFIIPKLGECLLLIASKSLSVLWIILTWLAHWHLATWQQAMPSTCIGICTTIAFIFFLLPTGTPGRWFGIIWLLPLLFYQPSKPQAGEIWLNLLDVGQGLSAVVRTRSHLLLYDAGPKFNANFDMGANVVVPYLHFINAKKIDMLVISHGDNDHIGGATAIVKNIPVTAINTSVPEKIPSVNTQYCFAGKSWEWDQVKFEFIYPTPETLHANNDSSCVLQITNGSKTILLPGDIEKTAEKNLLANNTPLAANILIAPHHGSKTSAVPKFLQAVKPDYVLYATGYRNRYHFPHKKVVLAYQALQTIQLNTALAGEISFEINQQISAPTAYRDIAHRYWMDTN